MEASSNITPACSHRKGYNGLILLYSKAWLYRNGEWRGRGLLAASSAWLCHTAKPSKLLLGISYLACELHSFPPCTHRTFIRSNYSSHKAKTEKNAQCYFYLTMFDSLAQIMNQYRVLDACFLFNWGFAHWKTAKSYSWGLLRFPFTCTFISLHKLGFFAEKL